MMRRGLIALATAVLPSAVAAQGATAQDDSHPAEIVVTGRGTAKMMPDRAVAIVDVRTDASTPAEAASQNAERMQSVQTALTAMGYGPGTMSTIGYLAQPTYKYENGTQTLTGYAALNAIVLQVHDLKKVGRTVDAALGAGATGVRSLRFESSGLADARRRALRDAVEGARRDAEALARAAGGRMGDLVLLSTERPHQDEVIAAAPAPPSMRGPETPITPGEQTVVVTVQARWQFVKQ